MQSKLLTSWARLDSDLKIQLRGEILIILGINPEGAEYISDEMSRALAEGDFEKWCLAFQSENSKLRFRVEQDYSGAGAKDGLSFGLAGDDVPSISVPVTQRFLRQAFRDARFPLPPNPVVAQDIQKMNARLRSAWIAKLAQNPWHPAVVFTCSSLLETLVKSGAVDVLDATVKNSGKGLHGTLLEAALTGENIDAAKVLLRLGSKIEQLPTNRFGSVKAGDYQKFLSIVAPYEWMRGEIDEVLRTIAASGMHASIASAIPVQQNAPQGGRRSRHDL